MNEILNIRNVHCYMDNQSATAYLNAECSKRTWIYDRCQKWQRSRQMGKS